MLQYLGIFVALSIFISPVFGVKTPVCRALNYTGYIEGQRHNPHETFYTYSYTVSIAYNHSDATYPNILTIFDFQEWSLNNSIYYRNSSLFFGYYFDNNFQTTCPSRAPVCSFKHPNAPIDPSFRFTALPYDNNTKIKNFASVFAADGVFFGPKGDIYGFNGDEHGCYGLFQEKMCSSNSICWHEQVCCSHRDIIEIPDKNDDICETYETKSTVYDQDLNTFITFQAVTEVLKNPYGKDFYINVIEFTSINHNDTYIFPSEDYLYQDFACRGNTTSQSDTCGFGYYEKDDFQIEFILHINHSLDLQVGELIRKNGTYMKNVNVSYSKVDPCWKKSASIPYRNLTHISSFCCTKFVESITTPPPRDPRTDAIGTPCSNDTWQAWLDIVFVIDVSNATTFANLEDVSARLSSLMQIFNISNKGEHTSRAAVITFATNVTIKFNLNDSNTGSDTWLNHILIMLPHYHKSNDSGANANDALKVAQNMLTYSQPSFRVPTIFLIAAGYNSTGYLPNFGDTRILSLSYAPENSSAQSRINRIATRKQFSFNSTLPFDATYQLMQANCFCPKNSYQLQNTVANVQTLYADCYFGSTKAALPSFELCNPGTLAIINSEKKFDDVFYAILSDFKYIKNFTIGFHKSLDGQWKWWDYDGSEFSVGDYPAFYKTPNPDDNFGYMSRYYGYNWRLETGRNVALPYLCQMRACDASNICNQTILT